MGEADLKGLVTDHNELGEGRFSDPGYNLFSVYLFFQLLIVVPRSKQSFKYDHLRKEASDLQPWTTECAGVEGLRSAIETEVASYVRSHYNHGVSAVFSKEVTSQ